MIILRQIYVTIGYKIGNDGSVWTCWKRRSLGGKRGTKCFLSREFRRMKHSIDKEGYPYVGLRINGQSKRIRIHTLVLTTFIGPKPEEMEACHKDGNRLNCHLDNLRWGTSEENGQDMVRHGTSCKGEKSNFAKLTEINVIEIRRMLQDGYRNNHISQLFSITPDHVSLIKRRKVWKHI